MISPISRKFCLLTSAFLVFPAVCVPQHVGDPHRPTCLDGSCRVVRTFIKTHYCGKSPFGNGPGLSCEIRELKKMNLAAQISADYDCSGDVSSSEFPCHQKSATDPGSWLALLDAMHSAGLPVSEDRHVVFTALTARSSGWKLAEAYFQRIHKGRLTLCQVVAAVDPQEKLHLLRTLRFQETDADVPTATQWYPIDIVDIDGTQNFVLIGDAYENHWFEALALQGSAFKTVFSGLGYSL